MNFSSPPIDIALSTRRRIAQRLLPFLFTLFVIAFLDRVNVSYAALEMTHDLNFSNRVFGFGSGIFFVGYLLFEIPGCLIVERWSARKWFARIMVTWGLITVLMAFIRTPMHFYLVRILLGAAEAGFFPGILVYMTHWFRSEDRAKAGAMFMIAIPVANIVGSPLGGFGSCAFTTRLPAAWGHRSTRRISQPHPPKHPSPHASLARTRRHAGDPAYAR